MSIIHNDLHLWVKTNETINPNIPYCKFENNDFKYISTVIPLDNPGEINKTPNQPEVRFTNIDVTTSKTVFRENRFIK